MVGLTGSIGMGKSTVAQILEAEGVPVFDADAVVHALQGPTGRLIPAIEAAFPGTTSQGGVDRSKLGDLVFGDPACLARLEEIVHPAVADERTAFLKQNSSASIVVFDIPLLFEKERDPELDFVIVVSAPPQVQRARVLGRPGMTIKKFEQILSRQMPDAEKRARADFVIATGTTLEETTNQVRKVLACLNDREGR